MLDRDAGAAPGPKFSQGEDGAVLFSFVLDRSSVVGPRAATAADQEAHPDAWKLFCEQNGIGPLDRDARDGAGGSLRQDEAPTRRRRVKNEPAVDRSTGS